MSDTLRTATLTLGANKTASLQFRFDPMLKQSESLSIILHNLTADTVYNALRLVVRTDGSSSPYEAHFDFRRNGSYFVLASDATVPFVTKSNNFTFTLLSVNGNQQHHLPSYVTLALSADFVLNMYQKPNHQCCC